MHRLDEGRASIATDAPLEPIPDLRQRRRMVIALAVLLIALALVLVRNRHILYSPAASQLATEPVQATAQERPAPTLSANPPGSPVDASPTAKSSPRGRSSPPPKASSEALPQAPAFSTERAVLPALQVEVVAGDVHHQVQPGNNSIKVDMQPGVSSDQLPGDSSASSSGTINASQSVRMSAVSTNIVTHQVTPDYPLLAKQMKVQGAVVLQALIDKQGAIQDLRILDGPAILSSAAREAVRQWRFKPYYQGSQPVETQARITVNFTISTY